MVRAGFDLQHPKKYSYVLQEFPGQAEYRGEVVHTARWPAATRTAGLRVGLVGTGCSAVQVLPAVASAAAAVTLFQRTPAWVLPKLEGRSTPEPATPTGRTARR